MILQFRISGLIITLMIFLFFFARPFLAEPTQARVNESIDTKEQVFQSVVTSFTAFSSLTEDVAYRRDSIYPVVLQAASHEEAIALLCQGFDEDLARSLAYYYLAQDQELGKLVLIPEESIPILTMQDQAVTEMTFRNDHQVRLRRSYYDCYALGDCYRYTIEAEKEDGQWKIYALSLEEIARGQNFDSPY